MKYEIPLVTTRWFRIGLVATLSGVWPLQAEAQDGRSLSDLTLERMVGVINRSAISDETRRTAYEDVVLVFIPGIPGSRLTRRKDQKVIWGDGAAKAKDLMLDDPYASTADTIDAELLEDYRAYGIVKNDTYGQALEDLRKLAQPYGGLKTIGVDWRQDPKWIVEDINRRLVEISRNGDRNRRIVLVGHSFGGLMSWYWQQKYGNREDNPVRHVFLLAAPLSGSCEIARTLLEGFTSALKREAPELLLDWVQNLVRHLLVGDLRTAAFTFPSTFALLPPYPFGSVDPNGLNYSLDNACVLDTTRQGVDQALDPLNATFWDPAGPGPTLAGNTAKDIGMAYPEFQKRVLKAVARGRAFRNDLDLNTLTVPTTYFYSSDYPTTQKVLLPTNRPGRKNTIFLASLGDGRVPLSTVYRDWGNLKISFERVTETHGDLPKSGDFQKAIAKELNTVANILVLEYYARTLPVDSGPCVPTWLRHRPSFQLSSNTGRRKDMSAHGIPIICSRCYGFIGWFESVAVAFEFGGGAGTGGRPEGGRKARNLSQIRTA